MVIKEFNALYKFDIYLSWNKEVIHKMKSLVSQFKYVYRSYGVDSNRFSIRNLIR